MLATLATSAILLGLIGARLAGVAVPCLLIAIWAAAAIPITVAAAVVRLVHAWRGPPVMNFPRIQAVRCGGAEAEAIRKAAQLRGTLGGAGHIYRSRLLLHAAACLAAAALATFTVGTAGEVLPGLWSLATVGGMGFLAVLLPARPFFYREAMHGEVLVSPPLARRMLVWARSGDAAEVVATSGPDRSGDGRGNSPIPVPTAPKDPGIRIQGDG